MAKLLEAVLGTKGSRDLKSLIPVVRRINELEPTYLKLPSEQFRTQTARLKERLSTGASLDSLLPVWDWERGFGGFCKRGKGFRP